MLMIAFDKFQPKGYQEVGTLNPAEHLMGFEPGTFWFLPQQLNH